MKPMQSEDGFLFRFNSFDSPMTASRTQQLIDWVATSENGNLQITQRGNLQLRGISPAHCESVQAKLQTLKFHRLASVAVLVEPHTEHQVKLIEIRDQLLDRFERQNYQFSPKFSVIIESQSAYGFAEIHGDIRIGFIQNMYWLGISGTSAEALWQAFDQIETLFSTLESLLAKLMVHSIIPRLRSETLSIHLNSSEWKKFKRIEKSAQAFPAFKLGIQSSNLLIVGLAFGEIALSQWRWFSQILTKGSTWWPLPKARLLVFTQESTALLQAFQQRGWITQEDDWFNYIFACPGQGRCTSGLIKSQNWGLEYAKRLNAQRARPFCQIHFSGCRKGCAHPQKADLTIAGVDDEQIAWIKCGSARNQGILISQAHLAERLQKFLNKNAESQNAQIG